jgi:hypothetical protein
MLRAFTSKPQDIVMSYILADEPVISHVFRMRATVVYLNQLTTLSPTKCTTLFPDILYYNITLNAATCFDPLWDHHQGITLK